MRVRRARRDDLEAIRELEASTFPDPWPYNIFHFLYDRDPALFLVAEEGGRVVGYTIGEIREALGSRFSPRALVGHVMNIAVEERLRGKGVGTALMDEVEGSLRKRGARHVTLEVRESNETARAFYAQRGYHSIGREKAYYVDEDAIIMWKYI